MRDERRMVVSSSVQWADWDGDMVCHHALSNDTHRLGPLASALCVVLGEGGVPQTVHELASRLGVSCDELEEAVTGLERLCLLERRA